jgi:ketosteroid isomerase-like protein
MERSAADVERGEQGGRRGDLRRLRPRRSTGLIGRLAEDIVWDVHGSTDLPVAGTWTGRQGVSEWFDLLGSTVEITLFEIDQMVAEGEYVAVFGRESGISQTTGRDYTIAWAHLWTLKDNRAVRFQHFLDGSTSAVAFRDEVA